MKKVIVPLAIVKLNPDTIAPLHFARETYIKKLVIRGLTPLFISSEMDETMIDELYKEADGALFMGGGDFDPNFYDEVKHPNTEVAEPNRDFLELYLLKKILKDKMPFLGICRGCQALNIAADGTLIQHLQDIYPLEQHGIGEGKTYDNLITNEKHKVYLEKQSKIYKLINKDLIKVNSGHHQAVNQIGENLRIVGRSQSGVVEIIEHTDDNYFCFGIQSHPEAEEYGDLNILFDQFQIAVENFAKK